MSSRLTRIDGHSQIEVLHLRLVIYTNTDLLQDDVQVVRSNTVAGPLREERNRDDNAKTAAVSGGAEEGKIAGALSSLGLKTQGLLDLFTLELNKFVVDIPAVNCVVRRKDTNGLLFTAVGHQPARRLGQELGETLSLMRCNAQSVHIPK
jgi:hypothetical protein